MGNPEVILLDTHALVWLDIDEPALGKTLRRLIATAWERRELGVSAISFWECAMLHTLGRLSLPKPPEAWRTDLMQAGFIEWPLDGGIAILASALRELHKDPADRFIAATASMRGATLVTADERLLAWKHAVKRQDARK